MILSIQQIHELSDIIAHNQALAIGQEFGVDFLTDSDKRLLEKYGVDLNTLYKESEDTIFTSFHFGLIADSLNEVGKVDSIAYQDLYDYISHGDYIPLTQQELATLNSIKTQSLSSLRGNGNRIFQDVNNILQNNSRKEQESFIKKEISNSVRNKNTVREIANEIARKTGDWSRDFDRIVQYTSQTAYEQGKAAAIARQFGEDSYVYKQPQSGACPHCVRLFLTDGWGSAPKVFKLSELEANGSNIGRKVADWLPTVDSTHPYCFDDQTEVLTNKGWKFFKDLDKTELFMSVNLETGEGEWQKAVNWIDQEYKGEMCSFQNKNFDLVTTPNHFHVIQTYNFPKLRLVEANKLPNTSQFLLNLPKWVGIEKEFFEFDKTQYKADDFLEFLGYFISEGCLVEYKTQKRIHIAQSEEEYCENIARACERVFGKVSRCSGYLQVNLSKEQKELFSFLSLGKSYEKHVPQEVKERSPRQIEIFLSAFCKGNGSVYRGREWDSYKCKDYRLYYTSSKQLADDLGELILKIGKRPSFDKERNKSYTQNNNIIIVSELSNRFTSKPHIKEERFFYEGQIYDVELERNHTLFVRRNGKVCVSGNCRCPLYYLSNDKNSASWDSKEKQFKTKKVEGERRPRPKVRAIVGGVEVFV